ncbi:MAG: hypothetical protein ABW075_02415 [Aeromicrobium sp.]
MANRPTWRRAASRCRRWSAAKALRLHEVLAGPAAVTRQRPAQAVAKARPKPPAVEPPAPPMPPAAKVFDGVAPQSLFLASLRHGETDPVVSLVVPPIKPDSIFAGVATALQTGRLLALALDRPLRVVPFGKADPEELGEALRAFLAADGEPVPPLQVVPQRLLPHSIVSRDDVWVVTYWTTAHAADVACRVGVLDPSRVVYLVQDYEPGFHAWSVAHALTRQTYRAGFHHVVNSASLARYLADREGPQTDHGLVFAPHLDRDRLMRVAADREASAVVRVFFYGRPGKPRNLFQLGVAALRAASLQLADEGIAWEAVSAGEEHPDIDLPTGATVRSLGTLGWQEYYDLLARTDVGLSLMHSPHPSHPPLEVAVSGGLAVTNDLDGSRQGFHERVTAVAPDPDLLATALVDAVRRAAASGPQPFTDLADGALGRPLDAVVRDLVQRLP